VPKIEKSAFPAAESSAESGKKTRAMAHEEAAFSNRHSAINQEQHPPRRHGGTEEDNGLRQNQNPFTTEGMEESKTSPLIHGKPGQENADEQAQDRAQVLALKLAQTYEELTRLLERNPGVKREITQGETKEDKVYQKLKLRLKMADMAPRCRWVRQDGTSCGSPQLKQHIYCFAHKQMAEARTLLLMLPPPEDANAIQVGLMRIQKAVIEDTISMKKAGLLLYSMQLALTNVGQTTFGQAKDEEMVRETVDEEEAFSENRKPLTTKDTKGTEKNQGLPLMNADDTDRKKDLARMDADERGLQVGSRPVEWKPTPDMYRMDTREGMEAYEASFGMKIKPGSSGEQRPIQAVIPPQPAQKRRGPGTTVIAPEERAEVHNSSLRDERLPKGPRSQPQHAQTPRAPGAPASELLDADTGVGSVLETETYANLG
jgi:hypothetical protein